MLLVEGIHRKEWTSLLVMRAALLITLITVFEFPVTLAQDLASQPPAKQEPVITNSELRTSYTLGPEDQISITALDMEEISKGGYRIDGEGYISVPLLGRVKAGGMTVEQFEAGLIDQLKTYVHDPQITVAVTEFRSQTVSVLGAVSKPGVQVLQGRKILVEVLSMAGGTLPDAGYSLKITRKVEQGELPLPKAALDPTGKFYVAEVNLNDILKSTKPELNIQVQPDDTISVPRGELVYVIGEVKKAGGYVLNEKMTVSILKVLALAQGLTPVAAPKAAAILRERQGASRQEIPINLKDIMSGKTQDIALMPNDILFVPNNAAQGIYGETGRNRSQFSHVFGGLSDSVTPRRANRCPQIDVSRIYPGRKALRCIQTGYCLNRGMRSWLFLSLNHSQPPIVLRTSRIRDMRKPKRMILDKSWNTSEYCLRENGSFCRRVCRVSFWQ